MRAAVASRSTQRARASRLSHHSATRTGAGAVCWPIDNFFEWRAIKGAKTKQPYAIAMKSGEPFALAAIWENWQRPETDEWVRTFAVITCPANEIMTPIHDRMPVIIASENYDRWIANIEPDPRDLLVPYPSEPMTMWPISTRVNKPEHDDAGAIAGSW
jgi:putative SOS response-associated peptidase YedK